MIRRHDEQEEEQKNDLGAQSATEGVSAGSIAPEAAIARHTPGPWTQCGEDEPAGCRITIENGDGVQIAEVLNFDDFPCLDQDDDCEAKCERIDAEARANAHLIAAAPELLEALKHVMGWIDAWSPTFTDDAAWPEYEHNIKAAIAKAEGQ